VLVQERQAPKLQERLPGSKRQAQELEQGRVRRWAQVPKRQELRRQERQMRRRRRQ
jgi:hypothetical protein